MLIVRNYEENDWESLKEIHDAARMNELSSAGLPEAFLTLEETYVNEGLFDYELAVAQRGAAVVGFIAFTEDEIAWLYVLPGAARQGVGRALVSHALNRMGGKIALEVLCGNDPAIKFYESMGFKTVEIASGKMPGNEAFNVSVHVMEHIKSLR